MCCVLCFVLSPKQSGVLECHLSHISKNENYELCIFGGFLRYDRKKKVLVVCLVGARSLLRPEKRSSNRLSGGCAITIMTGKKKVLVVCLAGAQSLLRPKKKILVVIFTQT